MLDEALFRDATALVRIAVVSCAAYASLVLILRISGKRTLSKLNAFDLVVTVALGSSLSNVILSQDTPLVNGIFAFCMLIGLQFVATWASVRSRTVSRALKALSSRCVGRCIRGRAKTVGTKATTIVTSVPTV